ncbi:MULTISPECIES: cyanoexosortase A [unclassified Anabaena]|uniref:cyanoexosortase A n=1 Tax=unclassified Anabaena TaxID=2619674 RepID=UPI0008362FCB|nr:MULTISPECIES: cyanoexosortase A [unclassified Anabaena]
MEHTKPRTKISIKNPEFLLIGIGASLIAIHLSLFWREKDSVSVCLFILFCANIWSLLQEKRHSLNLESGFLASTLGFLLIAFVFINSIYKINFTVLLALSPFISAVGLILLASGFQGLKHYWLELLTISFFSLRTFIPLIQSIDISIITAKFAAILLWYTGFDISISGVILSLPTGSVKVYSGCSGMVLILDTLSLAVLFLCMFELSLKQKIIVPLLAATLAFIINAIRVCLMAILVAQGDQQAFNYWHEGDGSLLFSTITAFIFCCFCWFILSRNQVKNQKCK